MTYEDKEVTNFTIENIDSIFDGMKVNREVEAKPSLMRQMIWDAHQDQDVEGVIAQLGMIPSSPDVWKKERDDSHERINSLTTIRPTLKLAAENMSQIHAAKMMSLASNSSGVDIDDLPDGMRESFQQNALYLSHSSIISTVAALQSLGLIRIVNEQ